MEPLTKHQLKALRSAKRVSFYQTRPGEAGITVVQVVRGKEVETDIPVRSEVRSCREERQGTTPPLRDVAVCHYLLWSDSGGEALNWRSIGAFLKAGDVLMLHWGANYFNNGYLDKVELHGDRLSLRIQRGDKRYGFIVATSVCANNTARMVRRGPYNMD